MRVCILSRDPFRDSLGFHPDPYCSRRRGSLARRRSRPAPSGPARTHEFAAAFSLCLDDHFSVVYRGGRLLAVRAATPHAYPPLGCVVPRFAGTFPCSSFFLPSFP